MSSKILNSNSNRCFDVTTKWMVKDNKVVIDKSDTDQNKSEL